MPVDSKDLLRGIDGPLSCFELMVLPDFKAGYFPYYLLSVFFVVQSGFLVPVVFVVFGFWLLWAQAVIRADARNAIKNTTKMRTAVCLRVLAVNFNNRRNRKKKTAPNARTRWALLSLDMPPKTAHACGFPWGLEKMLDLG